MDVLLIRHASAVSAVGSMHDEDRFLNPEGRATARRVGAKLASLGIAPDVIYTSPLVRAVQTAELLAAALSTVRVESHRPLSVDIGSTEQALSVLARHRDGDVVLLVTHEPKVRALAASLAGARSFPGFPTTGVAAFHGPRGATRFRFRLDPSTLALETALGPESEH